MRTSMRRARMSRFPPIPHSLLELTRLLQDPRYRILTMTDDGLDNLYAGSVTDTAGRHHILFASERMLQKMREFNTLHGDGTFKIVPVGAACEQVFCIVGVWQHHIVPLAYALMETRTELAYTALFELLQHLLGPQILLTRVITDFEAGQQNAWENVFRVHVQGCLWHYSRRFLIVAGQLHLIIPMREIEQVRRIVRLTMALPLLPVRHIRRGFRLILETARDEGQYIFNILIDFLNYVNNNWILSDARLRRMCVFGSEHRTNNACETNNRDLRKVLGNHPNIFLFMEGLVRIERNTRILIIQLSRGQKVTRPRKRKAIANDETIERLSNELLRPHGALDAAVMNFLRRASHLMDGMIDEALH
ncbi:Pol polyprotein [Frankliniella fusca]|uniref:Pol polyprotein n=1 Tax=Frankliniella fusca TaxID=407009 RepID=A0AAE1LN48_9NEOP|nr:Pol polyprotein [Frankliniella fusca]